MSLTETERKEVVKFNMDKANDTLAEIPVLIQHKFYRTTANRLYYACFYAATALLINDGYEAHTHSGVKILLGLHYIKENKIEKTFGKMYEKLFDLRQQGDYSNWIDVKKDAIIPLLKPAEKFIAEIEKLINSNK